MTQTTPPGSIAEALLELSEQAAPLFEQAKGVKAKMLADGRSADAAETAGAVWLVGSIQFFWSVVTNNVSNEETETKT